MSINEFISRFNIKPADAIIMQKKFFGMLDHYVIYLGIFNYKHVFVANYTAGVRAISNEEIATFLQSYVPSRIDRFPGPANQRPQAVKRAKSLIGQKAYNFVANNCEHFKNFVHRGIPSSSQVEKAGAGLAIGGIALAAYGVESKNNGVATAGAILTALGLIAVAVENSSDK